MVVIRACACALLALVILAGPEPRAAALLADGTPALSSVFGPAGLVRDTNGDGIADSVAGRIVVPAAPTAREIQAAANIAARLGFETTALTLPILVRDSDARAGESLPILLGKSNAL